MRTLLLKKITAVFLLLLFLEKAGLRLWFHDCFHESSASACSTHNPQVHGAPCGCLDDFMAPADVTAAVHLITAPLIVAEEYPNRHYAYIFSPSCFSGLLRAPPAPLFS